MVLFVLLTTITKCVHKVEDMLMRHTCTQVCGASCFEHDPGGGGLDLSYSSHLCTLSRSGKINYTALYSSFDCVDSMLVTHEYTV